MSAESGPQPADELQRMFDLIGLSQSGIVSIFIIDGPVADVPIEFTAMASLDAPISHQFLPNFVIVETDDDEQGMIARHSAILKLSIPNRVSKLNLRTDTRIANKNKNVVRRAGLPYAVIGFGKQKSSEAPVTILASIAGEAPQNILRQFQNKSRERLASLN